MTQADERSPIASLRLLWLTLHPAAKEEVLERAKFPLKEKAQPVSESLSDDA
jgi:hypothetical protein